MFLGIDPGVNGGLVLIDSDGSILDKALMPYILLRSSKEVDLQGLVRKLQEMVYTNHLEGKLIDKVILEKVWAMPGNGAVSSFKFGYNFGVCEMALVCLGLPYVLVNPRTWSKAMHEGLSKDIDPKKRSLLAFQRLYPNTDLRSSDKAKKPHDGLIDALLIAEYGRRSHG